MAAPAYTTDLADIIADMPNTTGWTLISSGGGGANALQAPESDYFIQGASCISRNPFSSSIRGMVYDGGAKTITSGHAIFIWVWAGVPNAIATEAAGGIQALVGSGTGALKAFYIRGSDTYPYGGWVCVPYDPELTSDVNIGSPTATRQFFGARWNVPATGPARGNPFAIDAIRFGRTLQVVNGETANFATFAGAATQNDSQSNRWGLFQVVDGGYLQQGLFLMGTAGTAVDFRDSNRNIAIANTKKVVAGFNGFEVRNASSNVEWLNIQISALGTVSRGYFEAVNNATIFKSGCVFTDMNTFIYLSNSEIVNSVYRRCGKVTQGSAIITGCIFDRSTADAALNANATDNIEDCDFVSSGTGHAIEGFSTAGDYNLNQLRFEGYAVSNGSTGNEAIRVLATTGTVNLYVNGGSTPSIRTAGATVNVIVPDVTITIAANVSLIGAEIRIYDLDGTLPFKGTELSGTESHNAATYTFSGEEGNLIWIQVMKPGYEEYGSKYTIPSANTTLNIVLNLDVNA
jgi:hypothetical protein